MSIDAQTIDIYGFWDMVALAVARPVWRCACIDSQVGVL